MAQPGACCGPEIPVIQAKHLQASGPPGLLLLRNNRLPGKPARPDDIAAVPDGPAQGRLPGNPVAGRKASRERRAAGGVATAWPEAKGYNLIKFFMTDDVRRIHPGSHGKGDLRDYR